MPATLDLSETVVTVSKPKTLATLDVVKMLTAKKNVSVKVDGHENNPHVNVMMDIKVTHSRDVLIQTNALQTPIHAMKMKNVTITMVVSNVNVLLVMNAIATVTVSTLMNALPTILTSVIRPRDFASTTMAVTHVHVKLVTLVTVLIVMISTNVPKELMFAPLTPNVPTPSAHTSVPVTQASRVMVMNVFKTKKKHAIPHVVTIHSAMAKRPVSVLLVTKWSMANALISMNVNESDLVLHQQMCHDQCHFVCHNKLVMIQIANA